MPQCLILLLTLGCQCLLTLGTPVKTPLSSGPPKSVPDTEFADLPLLVPDVSKIDVQALKDAAADKFLALWTVFVSGNDVMVSEEPWTLFLPMNKGLPKDPSFLTDKEFTRDVLLNHVILGELVNLDIAAVDPLPYYSLSHSELSFTSLNGENFVNDIKINGEAIDLANGKIYIIEGNVPLDQLEFYDYIQDYDVVDTPVVKEETLNSVRGEPLSDAAAVETPNNKQSTKVEEPRKEAEATPVISTKEEEKPPKAEPSQVTPRATRFDKFRKKSKPSTAATTAATEPSTSPAPTTTQPTTIPSTTTTTLKTTTPPITVNLFEEFFSNTINGKEGKSIGVHPPENEFEAVDPAIDDVFLTSMKHDLEAEYSNGHEFLYHFNKINLDHLFQTDKNYTAVIATDDAFYDYYPIDWGFNPFQVDNFTKDVLLNHIVPGSIDIHKLKNGTLLKTIGGRHILVTNDQERKRSYLNGELLAPEGEVVLPKGRLYFLNKILFVDYDRVNELKADYPFLETGPLLSFPWPTSPFLSHLYKRLQESNTTKVFSKLLLKSNIAHKVSSIDQNLNRLSYTAFVPKDTSLAEAFPKEQIESMDSNVISEFLLSHLFPEYIMQQDLSDEVILESLSGTAFPVKVAAEGDIMVGDAKIIEPQQYLYNLGAIYILNKPLEAFNKTMKTMAIKTEMESTTPFSEESLVTESPTDEDSLNQGVLEEVQEGKPEQGISVPFPSREALKDIFSKGNPEITFETRTEISFSKQVNDGEIIPVPKEMVGKS